MAPPQGTQSSGAGSQGSAPPAGATGRPLAAFEGAGGNPRNGSRENSPDGGRGSRRGSPPGGDDGGGGDEEAPGGGAGGHAEEEEEPEVARGVGPSQGPPAAGNGALESVGRLIGIDVEVIRAAFLQASADTGAQGAARPEPGGADRPNPSEAPS